MTRSPLTMAQPKLPIDFEQLLALAPADRLALATRLIDSVEGAQSPEWEAAWGAELEARDAEMDSGAVVGIPWAEVHAEARARLRVRSKP